MGCLFYGFAFWVFMFCLLWIDGRLYAQYGSGGEVDGQYGSGGGYKERKRSGMGRKIKGEDYMGGWLVVFRRR